MDILFFKSLSGKDPIAKFLRSLSSSDRAKVLKCLDGVRKHGFSAPYVEFRQIKNKLWEIKIESFNIGIRIFYFSIGSDKLVLLHAYKKESNKAPAKEIATALKRMEMIYEKEYA